MQILPSYLSDWWETDVVYHAIGEVDRDALPFSFRIDDSASIREIECRMVDGSAKKIRCRFVSTGYVDIGQDYLRTRGVDTELRYTVNYHRPRLGMYATALWSLALAFAVGWAWRRFLKVDLRADFVACRTAIFSQPWLLILPYAASVTMATLALLVWPEEAMAASKLLADKTLLLSMLAAAVIVAPLFEEVVFRGLVYDLLGKAMGWWPAAIFGSLSFTSLHVLQFGQQTQVLSIFAAGMALCWVRRISGSVTLCILAHALLNLIVVLVQYRMATLQA